MKKVLTKIGYMAFGSLLTLIGYHFGNVDNNTVNAQPSLEKTENIVNRLRVRQLEIVGNDNSPRIYLGTNLDKGQIVVVDDNDVPHLTLKTDSEGGSIEVKDSSGQDRLELGVNKDNAGKIIVSNNAKTIISLSSYAGKKAGGFIGVSSGQVSDNENENTYVVLAASDNQAVVNIFTKTRDRDIALFAGDGGTGVQIKETDKNSETRLNSDAITILNLKTDKPIVRAGVIGSDEGYVAIFDKEGDPTKGIVGTTNSTQIIEYEKTIRRTVPIRPPRVVPR